MSNVLLSSFLFALTLLSTHAFTQPVLDWDHTYQGSLASDRGKDIAVDGAGYVYVTGYTDNLATGRDCITIKYSPDGDTVWVRTFSNPMYTGLDEGVAIALDASGNVYVTGKTQVDDNKFDVLTLKYDQSGEYKWHVIYPRAQFNNRNDSGLNIAVDAFGNSYVVGRSDLSGVVVKYDLNGMEKWYKSGATIGGSGLTLVMLKEDKVYVGGGFSHIREYEIHNGLIGEEYPDPYSDNPFSNIIQYNPVSLAFDPSESNLYILSQAKNNINAPPYPNRLIIQKNQIGISNELAATLLVPETSTPMYGYGIDVDSEGYVYVLRSEILAGSTHAYIEKYENDQQVPDTVWSRVYLAEPGVDSNPISLSMRRQGTSTPDIYFGGNSASGDIFLTKFNSEGDLIWDTLYDCGADLPDIAAQLLQDQYDNIYFTGHSICSGTNDDIKTIKYCLSAPLQPSQINWDSIVCVGSQIQFSVELDATAEYYTWSLPSGWTGQSDGHNITVTLTDTAMSGEISVTATRTFCESQPETMYVEVRKIPATPDQFEGLLEVCSGQETMYSTMVPDADSYSWDLPDGWTGDTSGSPINVTIGEAGGLLMVSAGNQCGVSMPGILEVNVTTTPPQPLIVGPADACFGAELGYSIANTNPQYEYTWTIPPGWSSTPLDSSEIIAFDATSGIITATANNDICISTTDSFYVNIYQAPGLPNVSGPSEVCLGDTATYTVDSQAFASEFIWAMPAGWVIIDSTSSFITVVPDDHGTLTVAAANMCDTSEIVAYDVLVPAGPPDAPGLISGPPVACPGVVIVYSIVPVDMARQYLWIPPSGWQILGPVDSNVISVIAETVGDFTIRVRAENECEPPSAFSTLPVSIAHIDTPIVIKEVDTLIAPPGSTSYEWFTCIEGVIDTSTGVVTQSFVAEVSGEYAVKVTDGLGCFAYSACLEIVVGVADSYWKRFVHIYPNPTTDMIHIQVESYTLEGLQIFNTLGQMIHHLKTDAGSDRSIDMSNYPSGVYMIAVDLGGYKVVKRIVKQ